MSDPQPYTRGELGVILSELQSPWYDARLIATLRDYQRLLAENAALREQLRLSTIAEATAEAEANDLRGLGRLAGELLNGLREGYTPDGGDLQEQLTEAGVITLVTVTAACGEACDCAEWGFPATCYRNTPLGDYCIDAARSGGEET